MFCSSKPSVKKIFLQKRLNFGPFKKNGSLGIKLSNWKLIRKEISGTLKNTPNWKVFLELRRRFSNKIQ